MSSTVEVAPRRPKTFRLPLDLVRALEGAAEDREVPQTEIVEQALRQALGVAEEGSAAGPLGDVEGREPPTGDNRAASVGDQPAVSASPAPPQPRDTVGLASWLSDRTGQPRALCKAFVDKGRVKVGGKVCKDAVVSYGRLEEGVLLDGEPVTLG